MNCDSGKRMQESPISTRHQAFAAALGLAGNCGCAVVSYRTSNILDARHQSPVSTSAYIAILSLVAGYARFLLCYTHVLQSGDTTIHRYDDWKAPAHEANLTDSFNKIIYFFSSPHFFIRSTASLHTCTDSWVLRINIIATDNTQWTKQRESANYSKEASLEWLPE